MPTHNWAEPTSSRVIAGSRRAPTDSRAWDARDSGRMIWASLRANCVFCFRVVTRFSMVQLSGVPTVGPDHLAVDPASIRPRQERDDSSDILRSRQPFKWRKLLEPIDL